MDENLVVLLVGGVIGLIFFLAERSLSFFSWSLFEELSVPRSRRMATEHCLEERELVSVCFLVCGSLALALAAGGVLASDIPEPWPAYLYVGVGVLFLGWLLPEIIAWRLRDRVVLYLVPVLYRITGLPFRIIRRLFGPAAQSGEADAISMEGEPNGDASTVDGEAHEFLRMAVRLKHMPVREIMTPRTDMVGMPETTPFRRAGELSRESGYSRFPVYRANRDQIVGILHIKDLLAFADSDRWDKGVVGELIRKPLFIPETKPISELMDEFQRSGTHMGIVVDEYGGTAGLVTLEDVVEELIGEIHDEHEAAEEGEPEFTWVDKRTVDVQAVMHIEEINEKFNLDLPEEEDFDTLGGFVLFVLGKIPVNGETFEYEGVQFNVTDADARRVNRVRVRFEEVPRPKEKA